MTTPPVDSTRAAFGRTVGAAVDRHDAVLIDTDTGSVRRKPKVSRYINIGIAECAAVGMAGGLALAGRRSVVVGFAAFLAGRAYEFVKLDVALPCRPVVMVGTHAGVSGGWLGPTHHALEDLHLMAGLPNVEVIVPADASRVGRLLDDALRLDGPVYLRLGRKPAPLLETADGWSGDGWTVLACGADATFVGVGPECLHRALLARERLANDHGLHSRVIAVERLSGLPGLASCLDTGHPIVVVEESWAPGVVASRLRSLAGARILEAGEQLTGFQPPAAHNELLDAAGMSIDALVALAVRDADGSTEPTHVQHDRPHDREPVITGGTT